MEARHVINRRKSFRIDSHMTGFYAIREKKGLWKKCIVTNFSREGTGILFTPPVEIEPGSIIYLRIEPSSQAHPISIKGTLMWMKKTKEGIVGGIKW